MTKSFDDPIIWDSVPSIHETSDVTCSASPQNRVTKLYIVRRTPYRTHFVNWYTTRLSPEAAQALNLTCEIVHEKNLMTDSVKLQCAICVFWYQRRRYVEDFVLRQMQMQMQNKTTEKGVRRWKWTGMIDKWLYVAGGIFFAKLACWRASRTSVCSGVDTGIKSW